MAVFNYKTKGDPLDGLWKAVYNIKRTLKLMKIWEVNDISLGVNRLRRRQIRPMPDSGSLFKGPWFDFGVGSNADQVITVASGTGTTSYADWALGFATPTSAVVTVNAGRVRHGTRTVVAIATANITITDAVNVTWIYVAYTFGSTAVLTSSTTEPQSSETVYNHALHKWLLVGGVATLQQICSLGDISIPGSFA